MAARVPLLRASSAANITSAAVAVAVYTACVWHTHGVLCCSGHLSVWAGAAVCGAADGGKGGSGQKRLVVTKAFSCWAAALLGGGCGGAS